MSYSLSMKERAQKLADKFDSKELYRRLTILQDYQMSFYRINEQSEAAFRAEEKVQENIFVMLAAIKIAKEKEL